jgi:cephalosporin-C deacetylase
VPAFDLPLDELWTYPGRNPRPDDFDEYWAEALAELDGVTPDVALEPVVYPAPYAECFDLTFTGVRGARVYAKYARPVGVPEPHPGVAVFHGYSARSPDWFNLMPYVGQGYSVLALDCRGQGGRSQDVGGTLGNTLHGHIVRGLGEDPRNLAFRQIFLDTVQAARLLMAQPEVDAARVAVTGVSQGGGLSIACAALEPSLKLAAPVFPFLSDYLRTWEMDLATDAYQELRDHLRRFDPTHANVDDMFRKLGYIDVQHLAGRVRAEVLMATGLMDKTCAPSTQFAAYNKIAAPKELVLYPDFEHENLPGHDDRILAFFAARL